MNRTSKTKWILPFFCLFAFSRCNNPDPELGPLSSPKKTQQANFENCGAGLQLDQIKTLPQVDIARLDLNSENIELTSNLTKGTFTVNVQFTDQFDYVWLTTETSAGSSSTEIGLNAKEITNFPPGVLSLNFRACINNLPNRRHKNTDTCLEELAQSGVDIASETVPVRACTCSKPYIHNYDNKLVELTPLMQAIDRKASIETVDLPKTMETFRKTAQEFKSFYEQDAREEHKPKYEHYYGIAKNILSGYSTQLMSDALINNWEALEELGRSVKEPSSELQDTNALALTADCLSSSPPPTVQIDTKGIVNQESQAHKANVQKVQATSSGENQSQGRSNEEDESTNYESADFGNEDLLNKDTLLSLGIPLLVGGALMASVGIAQKFTQKVPTWDLLTGFHAQKSYKHSLHQLKAASNPQEFQALLNKHKENWKSLEKWQGLQTGFRGEQSVNKNTFPIKDSLEKLEESFSEQMRRTSSFTDWKKGQVGKLDSLEFDRANFRRFGPKKLMAGAAAAAIGTFFITLYVRDEAHLTETDPELKIFISNIEAITKTASTLLNEHRNLTQTIQDLETE